jgi:hypothetical protein
MPLSAEAADQRGTRSGADRIRSLLCDGMVRIISARLLVRFVNKLNQQPRDP